MVKRILTIDTSTPKRIESSQHIKIDSIFEDKQIFDQKSEIVFNAS